MDPISHGLIGLGLYSLVYTPTIGSAVCLGTIIGSLSPDFDIVTRIKGDYIYLKHHRVETHSILGLIFISGVTTALLSLIYKDIYFYEVFLWTFLGGLSHILFDFLNSYGVALLYPFNKDKYSIGLLMIYDPIFLLLSIYSIIFTPRSIFAYIGMLLISTLYLFHRWLDKNKLKEKLSKLYTDSVKSIIIMPSEYNLLKWHYIIDTHSHYIIGDINSINKKNNVIKKLKRIASPLIEISLNHQLGRYFKNFTPYFYVDLIQEKENLIVKMTDLRYRIKNEFKHHATFYYNPDMQLIRSVFHPFNEKNAIEINCRKSVDSH